jgi:allene oxide cyclase
MSASYSSSGSEFARRRRLQVITAASISMAIAAAGGTNLACAGETLHVIEHVLAEPTIHVGAKGETDSMGDLNVFANPVFDSTNTRQVGTLQGSCVRVIVGKSWECSFALVLGAYRLVLEGPYDDTGANVMAITGGTGRFAGAKGQLNPHLREPKAGVPPASDLIFTIL